MFGRQRKSECQRIQEMMSPYIDDRLNEVERDSVEFHTEVCRECRRNLESLQAAVDLLHRMPTVIPSRSFTLAEAPEQRIQERDPFPVAGWVNRVAAVTVPDTNWLRVATAAAVILLMVMAAGDLTGVFHSKSSPKVFTADENITSPTAESILAEEDNPSNESVPENGSPLEAPELKGPVETGIAENQTETGAEGDVPPQSSSAPLPDLPQAEELLGPAVQEDSSEESAYSWLRPVEITLVTIVLSLGALLILTRKQRRSLVS